MPSETTPPRLAAALVAVTLAAALAAAAGPVTAQSADTSLVTVNGTVRVHPTENATIRGRTDLAPDTELAVRVRSSGETVPRFFRSVTARVGDDGTFTARINLSSQSPGDTFTVTVVADEETVAEAEGRVVATDRPTTPTATPTEGATPEETTASDETGADTETSGPGFTSAVAVLAVAAGVVAAARRAH